MPGVAAGSGARVESRAGRGPEGPRAAAAGARPTRIFRRKRGAGRASAPSLAAGFPALPPRPCDSPMFPDAGTGPGGPGAVAARRSGGRGRGPARGAREVWARSARADPW